MSTVPKEILAGWSGRGKLEHELTPQDVENLWARFKKWTARRIGELVTEGIPIKQAVARATNESGMRISEKEQRAVADAFEKGREAQGKVLVEVVSPSEFEEEKVRADRAGDLVMQAKRVR